MRQTVLFSRNSDPETSHEAAEHMVASGKMNAQCQEVLLALRKADGSTSAELGASICGGHGRYVAARRLPDLEKKGMVRRGDARLCEATGRRALTWWVE